MNRKEECLVITLDLAPYLRNIFQKASYRRNGKTPRKYCPRQEARVFLSMEPRLHLDEKLSGPDYLMYSADYFERSLELFVNFADEHKGIAFIYALNTSSAMVRGAL
ncbi:hypothetical protein KIN20_002759 [Parelaphostrongylus tenuis]|uniref:Uncharacterized protein n=1 Tax=Parelaphostrongylus tenuis TaxID=148309 RepID=A0AAD5M099_PARTN|nr:hypothetical protein KIN20_002759 [Parelaphostrongylus tenuis]